MLIARLLAEPAQLSSRLEAAQAEMDAGGVRVASAAMLDFCGETLEIASPDDDAAVLRAAIEAHLGQTDGLVCADVPELPRVFVSDMDSTMIGQECIDELADFAGLKPRIAAITEKAMRGELDFEAALRERIGLLAGLPVSTIDECLANRITPTPGARTLVQTLKSKGCRTILVTGGFHHFADPIGALLGFDEVIGNRLDHAEGKLTGALDGPVVDSAVKRATLLAAAEAAGEAAPTMAAGDGANDIPMLEAATYGFAYRAKPAARAAANGWIERGDLTSVLRLLGIPEKDWITA